jgi:hypothetical protein
VAKGRGAQVWAVGLFVAGQVALGVWVHRCHPEMCDATWNFRLERLQARMAEAPGRPLLLVLGSSRPANGWCPKALGEWAPPGSPPPLVFNFATLGGGPVRELLTLRRLLAHGIKPRWVVAELWPLFWAARGRYNEQQPVLDADIHWTDVPVVTHIYGHRVESAGKLACENLTPAIHYRGHILGHYLPALMPRKTEGELCWETVHWATLDDWGWLPAGWGRKPPAEFAKDLEIARKDTLYSLEDVQPRWHVDWCVRQLIETCRREDIHLVYFLMPEHSALRTWFPPAVQTFFFRYLRGLEREYGLEVIDTRDWLPDEAFVDFCHLLPAGAEAYSARLAREVLRPVLAGAPLPAHARLRAPACISPADSRTAVVGP